MCSDNSVSLAEKIIEQGEDSLSQFKAMIVGSSSLAAKICAFANAQGGPLLIDVSDEGEIVGGVSVS